MLATDKNFYDLKKVHVVFAISTFALMAVTVWMFAADHNDEWREHQSVMNRINAAQTELTILEAEAAPIVGRSYSERVSNLVDGKSYSDAVDLVQKAIAAEEIALGDQEQELQPLRDKLATAERAFDLASREARITRAERDVAAANHGLGVRDKVGKELLAGLLARLDDWKQKVAKIELDVETNQRDVNAAKKALGKKTAARDELQAELKMLQADIDLMHGSLNQIAPDGLLMSLKHKVMEWPIVDGFNSHHRLANDWLPDLKVTLGMATTARYDRCRSCHVGIDNVLAGNKPAYPFGKADSDDINEWVKQNKFPHPYATHPNPDLFLTAASPHPRGTFGCTICHDGDGSGTSFQNAEHGPNSPYQHEVWKDDHNYHPNHHWELPMLPKRLQEATCLKCHHQVDELGINPKFGNSAPNLYEGYQLIQSYGCFGCHEIRGFDGDKSIGPDLRLEPDYTALTTQFLNDPWFKKLADRSEPFVAPVKRMTIEEILAASVAVRNNPAETADEQQALRAAIDAELKSLAHAVAANPEEAVTKRNRLMALSAADKLFSNSLIEEQPRLSAGSHALAGELKNVDHPGRYRKVGPSLRHIAAKTSGAWIEFWTEEPKRFRKKTRMPQFFKLTNQQDAHAKKFMPVELAGISHYLGTKSQPIDLEQPAAKYVPDPVRGQQAFAEKGCLACHQHDKFPKAIATFGPNLTKEHLKIASVTTLQGKVKRGEETVNIETINPDSPGFKWLYTWILDPERYHARTKMPNLFVDETVTADNDPAADIAAFLLMGGMGEYKSAQVGNEALDELILTYLKKALPIEDAENTLKTGKYPIAKEKIKGDEIELAGDGDWHSRKLSYVGRRTISQYGCYGCHDIPGFERARPIGTTLQDWGRKDPHKLAPEHIHEWLAHHGEPDGSSTHHRVADLFKRGRSGEFQTRQAEDAALSSVYFYDSLIHHGRDGFLWQKLRQPRSYDYEKTEIKGYDERLRMPKFPLNEDEIEKIATFVLGLVADPPAEEYLYAPTGDRIQGEQLLQKYNCVGCHMIDLPEITFGADLDSLPFFTELDPSTYADAFEHLLKVKHPQDADTGQKLPTGETVIRFKGLKLTDPFADEDPEDQFYTFNSWENLKIGDRLITMENPKLEVYVQNLLSIKPARGGAYAEWMVNASQSGGTPDPALRDKTWQAAPPPLYQEGIKVQTPWLYRFLREPYRIRHTTRLRMPRFNMSPEEARTLANYFAAVDGAPYPYQQVPERDPAYLAAKNQTYGSMWPADSSYLNESWQLLNTSGTKGLCVKCHAVGGREFKSTGAKDEVRGPNLDRVADRLRPDWTLLWISNPKWIAPYTGMARIFNPKQKLLENRFEGNGRLQTIGARDALMNYHRLFEQIGKTPDPLPKAKADAKTQPDNNSGE